MRTPVSEGDPLEELAGRLVEIARDMRDAVRSSSGSADHDVVRHAGGDDVFGVDVRADEALLASLGRLAGFDGTMVCEGFDEPLAVGDPGGPWRYLIDPVDGTRGFLAGKRSAWVLIGAGRNAQTLDDLEIGVAVEVPGPDAARAKVAWAVTGRGVHAVADSVDLVGSVTEDSQPIVLAPRRSSHLDRSFVTVVRLLPGGHEPIGRFADDVLRGFEVYDDLVPCTGGQLMGLASGTDAAVLDPRPHFAHRLCAHPYDLAALVVAREAGVIVEALDGGPLSIPLDTETPVGWAGYCNEATAAVLRPRVRVALGSSKTL